MSDHDKFCPADTPLGGGCECEAIAAIRADERRKVGKSMANLMRKHPYEFPSDYAGMIEQNILDGSILALDGEQE